MRGKASLTIGLALGLATSFNLAARADPNPMTLTAAGVAQFSLSTFVDGFPVTSAGFNACCGPLGIAFPTTGGVLVSDYSGNVRLFATDTDNQLASAGVIGQNYGFANAVGLASSLGNIYMT